MRLFRANNCRPSGQNYCVIVMAENIEEAKQKMRGGYDVDLIYDEEGNSLEERAKRLLERSDPEPCIVEANNEGKITNDTQFPAWTIEELHSDVVLIDYHDFGS